MPSTYDRRRFLTRAGLVTSAGVIAPALVRSPAMAAPDDSLAPFVHGVASGDPVADGVVIWTRVSGSSGPVEVRWVVAHDLGLTDVVAEGTATAAADRDHTVKVDVRGLDAGTWYFFGFEAAGRCSLTGRTKTAPAGPVDRLRFGVASCASYQHGLFNAYARLSERQDLDAVLHLGDYLYEYAPGQYGDFRAHEPAEEMTTLDHYRARHGQYKLDPDLRRLHQLFPFVTTWDDHESANDSWRDGAENHTEGAEGAWADRKASAQKAYEEWMPIRVDDPGVIYRHLPYGDLLDVFVLDTRLEGRDEQVGQLGALALGDEVADPERRMISDAQRGFLFDGLSASTAKWRFVAQQVMMAQLNVGGLPNIDDLVGTDVPDTPVIRLTDGGNAINIDQWDGYPAERRRFLDHLAAEGIGNVVVLTGDIHSGWANDLTTDPYNPATYNPVTGEGALGVEFVVTSVTSPAFEFLGPAVTVVEQGAPLANPHIKWVNLTQKGYTILDVTPERVQSEWWAVDTILEPSAGESLSTSFQVLDGANHLQDGSGATEAGTPAPATPVATSACATPATATAAGATATSGSLPATGGSGALVGGAALLGAAGLVEILRRRSAAG